MSSHSLLQEAFPGGSVPIPGIESGSPTLQADSLPDEPQVKPKNTGVGSLSLLQGIFPTQESDWGLLHYRWILYQMSYQSRQIDGEKIETVADYIFLDSKITVDSDCSHEIKRYLLIGRKAMTNVAY